MRSCLRRAVGLAASGKPGTNSCSGVLSGDPQVELPPLRARREDIALLVEHFRREVNDNPALDADITGARSQVKTFVIAAREDLQIARDVRLVLGY